MHHSNTLEGFHPILNFALTLGMFLFGTFMPDLFIVMHYHIPPIFIELLQSLAYLATFTVGAITVWKFCKKIK